MLRTSCLTTVGSALLFSASFVGCSRMQLAEKIPVVAVEVPTAKSVLAECPTLHGIYKEAGSDDTSAIKNIIATETNGATEIAIGAEVFAVDGQPHVMKNDDHVMYTATCSGGLLKIVTVPVVEQTSNGIDQPAKSELKKSQFTFAKLTGDGDIRLVLEDGEKTEIKAFKRLVAFPTLAKHDPKACPILTAHVQNDAATAETQNETFEIKSAATVAGAAYLFNDLKLIFNDLKLIADGKFHAENPGRLYIATCAGERLTVLGDNTNFTLGRDEFGTIVMNRLTKDGVQKSTLVEKSAAAPVTASTCPVRATAPAADATTATSAPNTSATDASATDATTTTAPATPGAAAAEPNAPEAPLPATAPAPAPAPVAKPVPPAPSSATVTPQEPEKRMPMDEADTI